jgi:hypothetical protein
VSLDVGLRRTIEDFERRLSRSEELDFIPATRSTAAMAQAGEL